MDDDINRDDQDAPGPLSTKALLIGLGGLAVIAAVLIAVRATRAKPSALLPDGSDNWQESLNHFAAAVQTRLDGLQSRVDDLAREPQPAPTSVPVGNGATPDPIVDGPIIERVPPDVSSIGADTAGAPPGPAAVSMPPGS
jgi:hypothetical protein